MQDPFKPVRRHGMLETDNKVIKIPKVIQFIFKLWPDLFLDPKFQNVVQIQGLGTILCFWLRPESICLSSQHLGSYETRVIDHCPDRFQLV